jgi:NAD+ synthetase
MRQINEHFWRSLGDKLRDVLGNLSTVLDETLKTDPVEPGRFLADRMFGYNQVADENIQARLRGMFLMHLSNAYGMLVLTTGNKSELALGYCTLGGDMMGTFNPIGDCYKTDVSALARYANKMADREVIPQAIIGKEPSAELKPDQKDTDSLLPYPVLDPIIKAYVEDYVCSYEGFLEWARDQEVCPKTDVSEQDYLRMVKKIDQNEFKRRLAAMCVKVHRVAFGTGRRLPIVKGNL